MILDRLANDSLFSLLSGRRPLYRRGLRHARNAHVANELLRSRVASLREIRESQLNIGKLFYAHIGSHGQGGDLNDFRGVFASTCAPRKLRLRGPTINLQKPSARTSIADRGRSSWRMTATAQS